MKLFKAATPFLSFIIVLSLIFTSIAPCAAQTQESGFLSEEAGQQPEMLSEEAGQESSNFTDVSHMSDEEFFGKWDQETETWTIEGKLNYSYSPDLAEVERLVKFNSYALAKEALLEYYRNRTSIPRADFNSGIQWEKIALNSRDAYTFEEAYITYTNITSVGEYAECTVDLGTSNASVFVLDSITKTQDMVCIASRETEYSPTLEIVREDGTSTTLYPLRDTYIRGYDNRADYGDRVYGDSTELYVKDSWHQNSEGRYMPFSSKSRRTYIAFDSTQIPRDIERAYLKFYAKIVPEPGVEQATEDNHEILVFNAYNKSWSEVEGENGTFVPMTWKNYKIAHYSWNGLPGGFDWIQPENVPSEYFRENTRWGVVGSLAAASLQTGNTDYMKRSMEIALDFISDTNGKIEEISVPEGRDIESANRCCEIPGIFAAYLDSELFNAEIMTAILKWLWEEMTYLYNGAGLLYKGNTTEPNKGNYAETNRGLWHVKGTQGVCTYFPEYADRDMWKDLSNRRLERVALALVDEEGCYAESTFGYANTMVSYFLAIYRSLQDSGDEIPSWYEERLGKFVKYLMYHSYPNHRTPNFGEGGAPNTSNALRIYLNLQEDPEIRYVYSNGQEGTVPAQTAVTFSKLKTASCRTGWGTDESMLFIQAKNGGNHNHKDSLAITFYAGDKELLADTGMSSYDGAHPHFWWQQQRTNSHNTIEIDGEERNKGQRGGNYLYNSNPMEPNGDASLTLFSSAPVDRIVAWTDATEGFRHYRNVSYIKNHNFIIVSDMVSPEDDEEHIYTQNWHTYAQEASRAEIDDVTKTGKTNYHTGSNLIIAQANKDNITLTLEKGFSSLSPNTTDYFCYTQKASGDVMYNTVLYPTQTGNSVDISVQNIDTGVDPTIASAMSINLFKNDNDVDNVFYYNSFEETPSERSFNGYTTNSANVTIQQNTDGVPSFLSMYSGSSVTRDGEELIVSNTVLEDIEISFDGDKAVITSNDENIKTAQLVFKAPNKIKKLTINGENTEYIYSDGKVYINKNSAVDFATDSGYFVSIIAAGASGKKYPFTVDISAGSVVSGTLAMPQCTYASEKFTVTLGSAVLSRAAKIVAGGHTAENVTATINGAAKSITATIPLNSSQQYADSVVISGSPVLERAREDLAIWTKDATTFVIGESSDGSYGEDYPDDTGSGGGGGGGGGGGAKPLPKPGEDDGTEEDAASDDTNAGDDENISDADEVIFEDCTGHWAAEDIQYMYQNGYVNGVSENSFAPENLVTRAEFAAMAVRILGLEQLTYSGTFGDVKANDWHASVVETAYKAGIIQGSDGNFRPNDNITREEMAVILMRVYRINQEYAAQGDSKFADSEEVSSWAAEDVRSACELGLVQGMADGTFAPHLNTTRAQAATVFKRLIETQQVKEG